MNKVYNVGMYLRFSREDESKISNGDNSNSIKNQKDIIMEFIKNKNDLYYKKSYIDDGISGTSYEREGFKEMIQDIESHVIDCVIVKDLSRLGREYIYTGFYMEQYFPMHNIRFIAILNNYDSINQLENEYAMDMHRFTNLSNERFASETSMKVKNVLKMKARKGETLGGKAPYGYKKEGKKLIIDEYPASIVRRIFAMYLQGKSTRQIALSLTKENIQACSDYKNDTPNTHSKWSPDSVRNILKNEVYIGNMVQCKTSRVSYKIHKSQKNDEDKWIRVLHTHEAIIDEITFKQAQEIMSKRSYTACVSGEEHLLSGLIFCKECGNNFTFKGKNIICKMVRRYGKNQFCNSDTIREEYINNLVKTELGKLINNKVNKTKIIENLNMKEFENLKKETMNNVKTLDRHIEENREVVYNLYKDKINNIISQNEFSLLSQKAEKEREYLEKNLKIEQEKLLKLEETFKDKQFYVNLLNNFIDFKNINRATLSQFIKKIEIDTHEKKINIFLNVQFTPITVNIE